MAYPRHYLATETDGCRCGRRRSIVHCIMCGSFKVRAIRERHRMPPGMIGDEPAWSCQKCAFGFPDHDRHLCDAPVVLSSEAKAKHVVKSVLQQQADQYPLTSKEEVIANAIDSNLPPLTKQEEDNARVEWAKLAFSPQVHRGTLAEYFMQRRRFKAVQNMEASDATSNEVAPESEDIITD
jgi:hypothetical protein